MSYQLATIVTDAPLDFTPEDNLRRSPKGELKDVLLKLEFTKLMDKLLPAAPAAEEKPVELTGTCESEVVADQARAEELLSLWRNQPEPVACLVLPDLGGLCVEWGTEAEGKAAVFLPAAWRAITTFCGSFLPLIFKRSPRR